MKHPLMRPGSTMLASRQKLTFEQRKKQSQSGLCSVKNKFICVLFIINLVIVIIFCTIYFDVASHSTPIFPEESSSNNGPIIIEEGQPPQTINDPSSSDNSNPIITDIDKLSLTSNTAYMTTLNIEDDDFLHLLHRRALGFSKTEYDMMYSIMTQYGQFATEQMNKDIESSQLSGKYIIITPAAQMCNRMRAFMGTMLLGILTKRIVFIDIGAEGYAARLNNIFINPGYEWEYKSVDGRLKKLINGGSQQKWTFPYEHLKKNRPPDATIMRQVCNNWQDVADKSVWQIDSHAAYLPVMARNEQLYKSM